MKSMNKKEGKKIAVMAAIIVGLMMFAFVPMAAAGVTSFTVTPGTGLAGAVDSYNALVTTDGVTAIDITIPAGFIGVVPMSGGVELVRIDFWNSSTKAYYGYATFTANDTYPATKIDAYFELGGVTARTTGKTVNYTPGATNRFVSNVGNDTSSVITKLPTETVDGSIEITINCTAFYLDDVMFAIKQFVRNPAAGDYVFYADGVAETVTIKGPLAYPTVYEDGLWFVDSDGNLIADICFLYGAEGANLIPLVGDLYGCADIIIYESVEGWWLVDTNHDRVPDHYFKYGGSGSIPLVGDVNQDGKDDIVVVWNSIWFVVDPVNLQPVMPPFMYGGPGSIPLVGDVNQDGKDDIVAVWNSLWFVDTTWTGAPPIADLVFPYGTPDTTPLVGDVNQDGKDDTAVFIDGLWFVNTTWTGVPPIADLVFLYGTGGMIPLAGEIR